MGQKILLRLRPAWAADTFLPEEDIIYTMLHEVCLLLTELATRALKYPLSAAHT
jgi:hypothetical protein